MPTTARSDADRLLSAVSGGLALWLAFPEHDLWWLAPVGVALIGAASWRAGFAKGALAGLLAGWALFVPTLSWSGIYVGALPWLALASLQALYVAAMCGLVGWGSRALVATGRQHSAYLLIPLGWVAQELARGTTPWGGFPWARLAFSQADGPLVALAALAGAPGVGLAVALIGTALLALGHALAGRQRGWAFAASGQRRFGLGGAAGWLLAAGLVGGVAVGMPLPADGQQVKVGFVQGNVPHPGLDFNAERRAVLDNHVRGTLDLAARGLQGAALVVWPENSSDIDPFRNADARAQIDRAVDAVGVPLLVGAVLAEPPGRNSNVSLLYRPGEAVPERYTKLHPVPFAEYIPYRSFFSRFTDAAQLAGNFIAGDKIGAFEIVDPGGNYWALPTICFEVAYDGLMRDSVLNPAVEPGSQPSLLVVQTNNATFGYSAESAQQFAISRLRAIEHGRPLLHVSTVGVSGMIAPDGSVTEKTTLFTADNGIASAAVRSQVTISDRLGAWPELAAAGLFLALLGVAALTAGRAPREEDPGSGSDLPDASLMPPTTDRTTNALEDGIRA